MWRSKSKPRNLKECFDLQLLNSTFVNEYMPNDSYHCFSLCMRHSEVITMSYTVHTVQIFQSRLNLAIFLSAGSHYLVAALSGQSAQHRDQLNCLLLWAILKPQGAIAMVCGGKRGGLPVVRVTSYLYIWFGNQNPNLFYLRTNNATKWQINQTTVDSHVHFTEDTIMYMYVNNLTGL